MATGTIARRLAIAMALACGCPAAWAQPVQCRMNHAFEQNNENVKSGKTPVWADTEGNLMFVLGLQVNTDGTKRSYSVSDFWGEQNALNNLCNAMSDLCAGLDRAGKDKRRLATQAAEAAGWPKAELAATKLTSNIIPMPGGKPCKEVDGFLVSATSLRKPGVKDQCDLTQYVDALATAAVVVPRNPEGGISEFTYRGVGIGDLAVAIAVRSSRLVPGVVGDKGPSNKLGEASVAMHARLTGRTGVPENYRQAKQWAAGESFVLIFKDSSDAATPFMSTDRIDPEAMKRFDQWGGTARASACIKDYKAAKKK